MQGWATKLALALRPLMIYCASPYRRWNWNTPCGLSATVNFDIPGTVVLCSKFQHLHATYCLKPQFPQNSISIYLFILHTNMWNICTRWSKSSWPLNEWSRCGHSLLFQKRHNIISNTAFSHTGFMYLYLYLFTRSNTPLQGHSRRI
jgi:hypothetical protein